VLFSNMSFVVESMQCRQLEISIMCWARMWLINTPII